MLQYVYNGRILTQSLGASAVPHMLLCNGRVWSASVGANPLGLDFRAPDFAESRRQWSESVEFIDLGGACVLPGLHDAHVHFVWWAENLAKADLSPAMYEEAALNLLQRHVGKIAEGQWVQGHGWSHNLWPDGRLPSRDSLDSIFPRNPVFLTSKCGHLAWVNSVALELAGLHGESASPDGGEIAMRAGAKGPEPTGILKERAIGLVESIIPAVTDDDRRTLVARATREAWSLGITSMHTPEDLDTFSFLQRLRAEEQLAMRVNFWIPVAALGALEELKLHHGFGDDMLRITGVKIFADGSLGGRTAYMWEPYENEPDNVGIVVTDRDELTGYVRRINKAGLATAVHAIGDRSVSDVLAAFETSQIENGNSGPAQLATTARNRVEHLQVFREADKEVLARVRPITSFQPIHLCADWQPADRFWGGRARYAYAMQTAEELGCTLAFGSDAPVESINPFLGLYAAVTRCDMEGYPSGGWYPEECVPLRRALAAYTTGPAVAAGTTASIGDLSPGKLADFIVLPANPLEMKPSDLQHLRPLATFVAGKRVYGEIEF